MLSPAGAYIHLGIIVGTMSYFGVFLGDLSTVSDYEDFDDLKEKLKALKK